MGAEFPYDEDPEETEQRNPLKELRSHARKLEREAKAKEDRIAELEQVVAARERSDAINSVTSTYGLTKRQAELFLNENEGVEVSPALVTAWSRDLGIALANAAESTDEEEEGQPFQPVSRSGSPPPSHRLSYEQWTGLLETNPAEAAKAVAEGRVDGMSAGVGEDGIAQARY